MAFEIGHVHLKTPDPQATAQYYIDNFGAKVKQDIPGRGLQLDLHGLQLNITNLIAAQNHEQHYGIEHMAVRTTEFDATMENLRANGVPILEELIGSTGHRIAFVQAPDGAQMEIIEKSKE